MKRVLLLSILFSVVAIRSAESAISVAAVIFLHDETEAVIDNLTPLLDGGITQFLLYNGGTGTIAEVIKKVLEKRAGVHAEVITANFAHDGTCKTYLCTAVPAHFDKAKFGLLLDGQWRISNVQGLLDFCEKIKDDQAPVYWIRVLSDGANEEYAPCIIRSGKSVVFDGVVDALPQSPVVKVPDTVFVAWERIPWGIGVAKRRYEQELKELLKYYAAFPHDPHTLFCLGQVYAQLNNYIDAYKFYTLRSHMHGDAQEDYVTFYKLGELLGRLPSRDATKDAWDLRSTFYMKAHEVRPWRAEPLIRMAQHYQNIDTLKAFLYAREASELPYPEQDTLCIDRRAYEYTAHEILSIVSWYVGEYEIGEKSSRMLVEKFPNNAQFKRNLEWYIQRKMALAKKDPRIPEGFGVDFNQSMSLRPGYDKTLTEKDPFWKRLKYLYDRYIVSGVVYADQPRIPKIMHQIWLGNKGCLPARYKMFQDTWLKYHPDWQYMLWTEKEIEAFGLQNKAVYDAATNYREKSDIARYEIVYRYGGMYMDTDFECFRSCDVFHHCCDFYSALENEHGIIANGFFGAAPGNKILKRCIDALAKIKTGNTNELASWQITGPLLFTNCIKQELDTLTDRTVIFPVGYVYPWYVMFQQPRYLEDALEAIRPESFAVHHWHGTQQYVPKRY